MTRVSGKAYDLVARKTSRARTSLSRRLSTDNISTFYFKRENNEVRQRIIC